MPSTAAKAEATGQSQTFEHDGVTYSVPPTSEWDMDAMEAYERDHIVTCVRLILGPEQFEKFKPKGTKRTLGDLNALFDKIQKATDVPN
ncbi:hypothetical protein CA850_29770 [Micromonospora echinospora]|uniref:Tail assembly chaperone n=1 Tax=Micromonospora echinospora TaxID=1877 RepID=A0A1C5AAW7_MICEC|nr:hypothetical protein [Micromonospora echinospora]OZV74768.1 hypothetical protein CA850_29770 [Micromonospora echinospora]SCF42350.1 hypothetical protein GA0070618_6647 [Micromonospora echinospora]